MNNPRNVLLGSLLVFSALGALPLGAQCLHSPPISVCMPVHGSEYDRFVVAEFKEVRPARYDVTYKVIQCPSGARVWQKTFRDRIVHPSAAIDGRILDSCPAEFLHLIDHPHVKQRFFRGSIFDDYGRHLKEHFDLARNHMGHLIYRGPHETPRKPSYLRMRLNQLCDR